MLSLCGEKNISTHVKKMPLSMDPIKKAASHNAKCDGCQNGQNGLNGQNGFNGQNGLNGRDGEKGEPGPRGPRGPVGPKGDTGTGELEFWIEAAGVTSDGKPFAYFAPRDETAVAIFGSNGGAGAMITNPLNAGTTGSGTVNMQPVGTAEDTGTGQACALIGGANTRLEGDHCISGAANKCRARGDYAVVAGKENDIEYEYGVVRGEHNRIKKLPEALVDAELSRHCVVGGSDNVYEYTESDALSYMWSATAKECGIQVGRAAYAPYAAMRGKDHRLLMPNVPEALVQALPDFRAEVGYSFSAGEDNRVEMAWQPKGMAKTEAKVHPAMFQGPGINADLAISTGKHNRVHIEPDAASLLKRPEMCFNNVGQINLRVCQYADLKLTSTLSPGACISSNATQHSQLHDTTYTHILGSVNSVRKPDGLEKQFLLHDIVVAGADNDVETSQTVILGSHGKATRDTLYAFDLDFPLTATTVGDAITPRLAAVTARKKRFESTGDGVLGAIVSAVTNLATDGDQGVSVMQPFDSAVETELGDKMIGRFVSISESGLARYATKQREVTGVIAIPDQGIVQGGKALEATQQIEKDAFGREIAVLDYRPDFLYRARSLPNYREIRDFVQALPHDVDALEACVAEGLITREWADAYNTIKQLVPIVKSRPDTAVAPAQPFLNIPMGYTGKFLVRQTGNLKAGGLAQALRTTDPALAGYATASTKRTGFRVLALGPTLDDGTPTAYILLK